MDLSPKTLRTEFARITEAAEAIRAKSAPLREQRDALLAATRKQELELIAKIRKLEGPLYEMEQTRASIVRALGGKTSAPKAAEEPVAEEPVADAQ